MTNLEKKAKELSDNFLEAEKQYRLGFVEAEQSNDKTKTLGETFVKDTKKGVKMLLSVDEALCKLFENTINSQSFDDFYADVLKALKSGGRIVISGCGSTGRLAMRIEASFRQAVRQIPGANNLEDKVLALMTGGDYAIIRAVESFEDYIELGQMQAREMNLGEKDILVGVTATGETTSILGTAMQALCDGAKVWMVVCTKPETILGKLKRADDVYTHKNCKSLYMNCGGMAVTGSTRMQSSTIEQAIISACLEMCLCDMFYDGKGVDKDYLVNGFYECIKALNNEKCANIMAQQTDAEASLYDTNGHVTYFADEYLLDVLADTTERGPTFSVPPFRPQKRKTETLSWAFVKNPMVDTKTAWNKCFERLPRCVDKTPKEYEKIGIKGDDIKKIPKINLDALYEYEIGNEPDAERESGNSLATWIGFDDNIPQEFLTVSGKYKNVTKLVLNPEKDMILPTKMKMFEHLAIKMMINTVSTGTMAKMGRIRGNYMVYINITNKKLVDRAIRIVSDLCGVSYEEACFELFLSKVILEERKVEGMVAIETIDRLTKKK